MRPAVVVPVAMAFGMAAFGAAPEQGAFAQARPPELIEINPASGPAGQAYPLQVTLRGTGFMPTGNTVQFWPLKLDLPSADGTRIALNVPKEMPSRGEVPPLVLTAGEYRVTVTTAAGTSNALTFT